MGCHSLVLDTNRRIELRPLVTLRLYRIMPVFKLRTCAWQLDA